MTVFGTAKSRALLQSMASLYNMGVAFLGAEALLVCEALFMGLKAHAPSVFA